jgi:hypothetical protein
MLGSIDWLPIRTIISATAAVILAYVVVKKDRNPVYLVLEIQALLVAITRYLDLNAPVYWFRDLLLVLSSSTTLVIAIYALLKNDNEIKKLRDVRDRLLSEIEENDINGKHEQQS